MKPRVFIGSSKEGVAVARAIQNNLDQDAYCTVWDQGIFGLSTYNLDALIKAVSENDFSIFVFSPSDVTTIRDQQFATVRDNVILELGMFIGRYGKDRNFIVAPRGVPDLRIPSDLLGLTLAEYDQTGLSSRSSSEDIAPALGATCNRMRSAIKQKSIFSQQLIFNPRVGSSGQDYPLKLMIYIHNSTSVPVVITSRSFKIGSAIRPHPRARGGNRSKGEYEIRFPDPETNNLAKVDYFLRASEGVTTWIPIDPNHTDEGELQAAIDSASCGEWHITYNWLGPNPSYVEHTEHL